MIATLHHFPLLHEKVDLVDSRLEGAVAERLFYTNFVVIGLSDIRKTQAAILRELEAQLAAD